MYGIHTAEATYSAQNDAQSTGDSTHTGSFFLSKCFKRDKMFQFLMSNVKYFVPETGDFYHTRHSGRAKKKSFSLAGTYALVFNGKKREGKPQRNQRVISFYFLPMHFTKGKATSASHSDPQGKHSMVQISR